MTVQMKRNITSAVGSTVTAAKDILAEIERDGFAVLPGFEPREGHIYTRVRAISARINQNFDGFPSEELRRSYKTFLGKPTYVNHLNEDVLRRRGRVVAAGYFENGDDKYIDVFMETNAKKYPILAKELIEGGIDAVSMGCAAERTICSYCGNVATGLFDMCDHVMQYKGQMLRKATGGRPEDVLVYEECRDLGFFELSFVFDPADETALASKVFVANKKESRYGNGGRVYCDLPGCRKWTYDDSPAYDQWVNGGGDYVTYDYCCDAHRQMYEQQNPDWQTARSANRQAVRGLGNRVWCDLPGCRRWSVPGTPGNEEWVTGNGDLRTYDYCCPGHREQYERKFPDWTLEGHVRNAYKRQGIRLQAFGEIEAPAPVDTLRDEAEDAEDEFHQYVESPDILSDPDLDKAKELDRREEIDDEFLPPEMPTMNEPPEAPVPGGPPGTPPPGGPPGAPGTPPGPPDPDSPPGPPSPGKPPGPPAPSAPGAPPGPPPSDGPPAPPAGPPAGSPAPPKGQEPSAPPAGPPAATPKPPAPPEQKKPEPPKEDGDGNKPPSRRNEQNTNPRKGSTMSRDSLAQRGRVASRARVAEDKSRNDQGEQEEVFISQTPPEEPVETGDGEKITNTEDNLVARRRAAEAARRRAALETAKQLEAEARRIRAEAQGEVPDPVAEPDERIDMWEPVEETQPKDASKKPLPSPERVHRAFAAWCRQTQGKGLREASNRSQLLRWAAQFGKAAKLPAEALYPVIRTEIAAHRKKAEDEGAAAPKKADVDEVRDEIKESGRKQAGELPEEFKENAERAEDEASDGDDDAKPEFLKDKESRRKSARRSVTADEKLDVAAPDGRVDVEAPTRDTTDEEAQESQFDKSDFGDNAGDDLADPDLSTDQNWLPGEGKKSSSVKTADGLSAVRLAEAYVTAGMDTEKKGRWTLAEEFGRMSAAVVADRTALLERLIEIHSLDRRSAERKTAGNRGPSNTRSAIPPNLAQARPQTREASAEIGNPDSDMFF